MLHVFAETNWVVDCAAPAHNKVRAALDLIRRAREGEIQLHLPTVCLTEAKDPLHRKFQPRLEAGRVRRFVTWAEEREIVTPADAATVRTCLDRLESAVQNDLRSLDRDLQMFAASPGLEIFPMNERMLAQLTDLSFEALELKPYSLVYSLGRGNCWMPASVSLCSVNSTPIFSPGTRRVNARTNWRTYTIK